MSIEQDKIFFKNYSIVLGILVVMIIIFLITARAIGMNEMAMNNQHSDQIARETRPVGQVRMQGDEEVQQASRQTAAAESGSGSGNGGAAAESGDVGKQTYNGLCVSCHGTGLPGAPQFGNKDEWGPRIAQGKDTLYQHALHGYNGSGGTPMPPKGGNPALSDDQVKAAVDYMVANSQ